MNTNGKLVKFLPVRGSFDSASRSSEAMRHWKGADYLSADAAISPDVRKLIISRARYEVANNGYSAGILRTLTDDCIGTGPRLQLSVLEEEDVATEIEKKLSRRERRWRKWAKRIHLSQKLKIARRTKAQDGEVFIRKFINNRIKGDIKLDITLFESDQVGSTFRDATPVFYNSGVIKEYDGITYDPDGNPSGYRFYKIHPGENGYLSSFDDSEIISYEQVIHYANIIRPGQHRGISEISSTLPVFNDLRRFTNAVLSAAETAAEISFLMSTDMPPSEDENGEVERTALEAGTVLEFCRNAGVALPEGWKASQLKAEQPTSTHNEFVRGKVRESARPLSMPLNIALGDSSGYNYASGRLDHQIYHRMIRDERDYIGEMILDNLLEAFESLDKIFNPEDYFDENDFDIDHEWMWDGFAHVDPLKEANAQRTRLSGKTTTLSEECGIEGKDWVKTLRQRVREEAFEMKLRKQYDLPDLVEIPQENNSQEEEEKEDE